MPSLPADLKAARQWRRSQARPQRKASPPYNDYHDLARQLRTDATDPWPVMDIARYLKDAHPEAKQTFAQVTLKALHRALCRRLAPK
jgi:hypothetical protein